MGQGVARPINPHESGWDFPEDGSVLYNSFVCGLLNLNLNRLKAKGCFSGPCDREGQGWRWSIV